MLFQLPVALGQTTSSVYGQPSYFVPIFLFFLFGGTILSLVAFVLGRARARTAGPAAEWFSLVVLGILLYFLQWLALAFALYKGNMSLLWLIVSFHTLFLFLASICAIMGFLRMKAVEILPPPPPPATID